MMFWVFGSRQRQLSYFWRRWMRGSRRFLRRRLSDRFWDATYGGTTSLQQSCFTAVTARRFDFLISDRHLGFGVYLGFIVGLNSLYRGF